jgi:hypothetical protein
LGVEKVISALAAARENMSSALRASANSSSSMSSCIAGLEVDAADAVVGFVDVVEVFMEDVAVDLVGDETVEAFDARTGGLYDDGAAAARVADVSVVLIRVTFVVIGSDGLAVSVLDFPYAVPLVGKVKMEAADLPKLAPTDAFSTPFAFGCTTAGTSPAI